ncbi:hypothetical protein ACE6H2_007383 [Prunus campanulata]
MGKNNTTLLLFVEGIPTNLGHLRHMSMFSAENLMCMRRPNVVLQGVSGCANQSKATADGTDHVDLTLEVGFMNDTFERIEGCTVIYLLEAGILMAEIGKDLLGKEARACLRRKGLMAALFLVLKEMNLLKYRMVGLL